MLTLLRWLWGRAAGVVGLLLPMAAGAAHTARPVLFWVLHVALLAAAVAGLFWVNRHFDLPRYLEAPTDWLAAVWLPLLGLLVYANLWAGFWLWRVLRPEVAASPFPDIDEAWGAAVAGADRAGADLRQLPLFLVLGRTRGGDDALFDAAKVRATPVGLTGEAPVRLYLAKNAAYLTCAECSLLGGLAAWAARLGSEEDTAAPDGPTDADADPFPSLAAAPSPEAAGGEPAGRELAVPLARDAAEIARLSARLRHLCFLVRRRREPYCGVNGVLVLAPEACTRTVAAANQAGFFAAEDLRIVADSLQIGCPVLGVVCDGEQIPGLTDFLGRIPPAKRGQRLGRKLPYVPRLGPADRAALVADAVAWEAATLVPRLVYRVMPAGDDPGLNARLFRFAAAVSARREALSRLFTRALAPADNPAVMAGGCFLAATGSTADTQGFLTDVFAQLIEGQNFVAWTPEGLVEERSLRRRTAAGYAALAAVVTGVLVAAVALIQQR